MDRHAKPPIKCKLLCIPQVSTALGDENAAPEQIVHAFEQVEVEIFKLLAYDPFVRFKRQAYSLAT